MASPKGMNKMHVADGRGTGARGRGQALVVLSRLLTLCPCPGQALPGVRSRTRAPVSCAFQLCPGLGSARARPGSPNCAAGYLAGGEKGTPQD